jgi:hypothetical protein
VPRFALLAHRLGLRLPEVGFATAKVSFLDRKLRLELLAGRSDHGCRKRFRQLDLGATIRAEDLRLGHGFVSCGGCS